MPFSPRGIEQSLVLPPRWPLILYTGTLYFVNPISKTLSLPTQVEKKKKAVTCLQLSWEGTTNLFMWKEWQTHNKNYIPESGLNT